MCEVIIIIIYIDVVFLLNLIMNVFILYVTSFVCQFKTTVLRLLISASSGAFIYCLAIVTAFLKYDNVTLGLIILFLMTSMAFKPVNIKEMLKVNVSVMITEIFIGGIGFYIFGIIDSPYFSTGILFISVASFYLVIKITINYLDRLVIKRNIYEKIDVLIDNSFYSLTAIVDTGFVGCARNLIIAEKSIFDGFTCNILSETLNFKSLGNDKTTLKCIKGETIINGELEEIIIGLFDGKLSNGEFNAIISSEFMGGDKFDFS